MSDRERLMSGTNWMGDDVPPKGSPPRGPRDRSAALAEESQEEPKNDSGQCLSSSSSASASILTRLIGRYRRQRTGQSVSSLKRCRLLELFNLPKKKICYYRVKIDSSELENGKEEIEYKKNVHIS